MSSDLIKDITNKREDELKKIEALKQRLQNIKKEKEEINKGNALELQILQSNIENLIQTANQSIDTLEKLFITQKQELSTFLGSLESSNDIKKEYEKMHFERESELILLSAESMALKSEHQKILDENALLKDEITLYQEKMKNNNSFSSPNLIRKRAFTDLPVTEPNVPEKHFEVESTDQDKISENEVLIKVSIFFFSHCFVYLRGLLTIYFSKKELKYQITKLSSQKEILLMKLRHLQRSFDSDESLSRALYGDLGAEKLQNHTRSGYLTKQGGTVKSWKRRYFILKDNFLFYYKKPKVRLPSLTSHSLLIMSTIIEYDKKVHDLYYYYYCIIFQQI